MATWVSLSSLQQHGWKSEKLLNGKVRITTPEGVSKDFGGNRATLPFFCLWVAPPDRQHRVWFDGFATNPPMTRYGGAVISVRVGEGS